MRLTVRVLSKGISLRRQWISAGAAVPALALLTAVLDAWRDDVSLTIVFLLYLAAVVSLAAAGGPIVGIASALVAFLVVNYFFTEPKHTLDVSDPERVVELVIFLAVSGTVAALVDTAGRRRDVIEERTAEAEELSAANDLRTALLRAVSHDLRTPLTTAKLAMSSLLASDVMMDADQRRELVTMADREIDRLVAIVENLLAAGRLQAGVLSVDIDETELAAVCVAVLKALDEEQRARVDNRVSSDLPLVNVDRALLERVLVNLVVNAITADPTGEVAIAAQHDGGMIVLEVVDHGPGLTGAQQADAFQPFQRFEDRGSSGGLGLGLAICAGFCQAMGTELTLRTTPGGGLTAGIRLPISEDSA